MVDFALDGEQLDLQKSAREFARKELEPVAAECDKKQNPRECFPAAVFARAVELGFNAIYVPKDYGGLGKGDLEASMVFEEIGAADAGFANALCISACIGISIAKFANKAKKESWLPKMSKNRDFILGFGVTEYGAGSEAYIASPDPSVGLKSTCKREGDSYVINGTKHFISNGGVGKLYGVATRNDLGKPMFGTLCAFMVEADTPGFRIGKIEDKMGQRLMLNGELIFDNVKVPKENLLGNDGEAAGVLIDLACSTCVTIGAACLGLARAAYEAANTYANRRTSMGQPLINHQAVASMLADMKIDIESARTLLWKVSWSNDKVKRDYPQSAMAKVCCTEVCKRVANNAMQIYGGLGYMRDAPIEKLVRDSGVATIIDGTSQILKLWISGSVHA